MILRINNSRFTRPCGFTLLETVIYLTVIGFIFTGFVSYALSVNTIKEKNQTMSDIDYNMNFVLNGIAEKIRSAQEIISPAIGATENSLEVSDEFNIHHIFRPELKRLLLADSTGQNDYLTNSHVELADLYFIRMDEKTVKIGIALSQINTGGQSIRAINGLTTATQRK